MKKKIFYILLIIIMSQGLGARISMAAIENYSLLEPLPCIEGTGNGCEGGTVKNVNVNTYIAYAFKIAIAMAGFLAVVMVIYGGFKYMLSESITSKGDAKSTINNAILGLLGALASYLILQTIDPRLVEINTTIPKIAIKDDGTVDSFVNQLSSDMKQMYSEMRDNVAQMNLKVDELQKKVDSIKAEINKNPGKREELETNLYTAEGQLKTAKAEVAKVAATSIGATYFRSAFDTINKDTAGTDLVNTSAVNTYKESLISTMDYYKTKASELGEYSTVTDINNTKQFYLDQIDVEAKFTDGIVNGFTKVANRVSIAYPVRKQMINDFISKYENPETDSDYIKYKSYPNNQYILENYKKLQDIRIIKARQALEIISK